MSVLVFYPAKATTLTKLLTISLLQKYAMRLPFTSFLEKGRISKPTEAKNLRKRT